MIVRVGIGVTLTWDEERFVVIAADYRHVTLRSLEAGFTRMVDADELVRLPNVTWHADRADSATGSAARVLDGLDEDERRIVDAWAEQFAVVKAAVDSGQPAKFLFEGVRTAMSSLTTVTSLETVRRKFHRYCGEGVLGLVDARHLNRGKRDIDSRIGVALSELGEKGTTRSSGTTSRTLDRLRWMLEEDHGDAIKDGFVQYLEGFTGGSVERRGRDEPTDRALALNQLQELLEDWIAIEWQNRPHAGLSDPMLPGRALTPNEMFRAYRRIAPELHVPFGLDEFIGFLPAKSCRLQDYGINHARRVYRSNRLTELRAVGAGGEGATRPCVIRFDPHNPLFVLVEHGDEFVPFRCVGDLLDEPMGGEIWQAAHAVNTAADTATREEAAYPADRMKRAQWVRPGKERNRAVRAAEVDLDPMHMTGVSKTIARETPTTEPDADEGDCCTDR